MGQNGVSPTRNTVTRVLLVLFAIGSLGLAGVIAFGAGPISGRADYLAGTTSGKIVAGALLAMAYGAVRAARDPWRERLVVQMVMVFGALMSLAVAHRLWADRHPHDPAWLVLPVAIAVPVLLAVFYPRRPAT